MPNIDIPTWHNKNKIGNLMARLNKHAKGDCPMTPTQIAAARLYLEKTLPSLAAQTNDTKLSGKLTLGWDE